MGGGRLGMSPGGVPKASGQRAQYEWSLHWRLHFKCTDWRHSTRLGYKPSKIKRFGGCGLGTSVKGVGI